MKTAIVLADDIVGSDGCKTAHGLIRKSLKYTIVGIIDETNAGKEAGSLLDGRDKAIPIFASVDDCIQQMDDKPDFCIVGMATSGGVITPYIVKHALVALNNGISVISGLHSFVGDHDELIEAARSGSAELIDIRRSRPTNELHFWQGDILNVRAPRIALLGTDCNLGKRTSSQFLVDKCLENDIKAEMIFTGQTGWLQGAKYGFMLDTTVNDFVSGEIEHAIVQCDKHESPDIIFLEGQSSLRNPSGPCGSELIVSAKAEGVILQYAPAYKYFQCLDNIDWEQGSIQDEIEIIRLYGSNVIAIILNMTAIEPDKEVEIEQQLRTDLKIPVINIMKHGVHELLPVIEKFIKEFKKV